MVTGGSRPSCLSLVQDYRDLHCSQARRRKSRDGRRDSSSTQGSTAAERRKDIHRAKLNSHIGGTQLYTCCGPPRPCHSIDEGLSAQVTEQKSKSPIINARYIIDQKRGMRPM